MKYYIRWMLDRDLPEVFEIENSNFEYKWTDKDFKLALKNKNVGMVAMDGLEIVGFMIYELHKSKFVLVNFATKYHRRGIGRDMIEYLTNKLSQHRRIKVEGAVREGNLAAQLFFRSTGFKATKILTGYYEDSGEDAYLMRFLLNNCEDEEEIEEIEQDTEQSYDYED